MMDPDIESLLYINDYSSNRKENVKRRAGPSNSSNSSTTPLKQPIKKRPRTLTPILNDAENQKKMEAGSGHCSDMNGRFKCNTCNKAFRLPSLLRRHEIIHSGEKPFKCRYCEQAFGRVDHRQVHERIHNDEWPYQCNSCGRKFRQLGLLKYHRRREHPELVDEVSDKPGEVQTQAKDTTQDPQNSTDKRVAVAVADKKDARRSRGKKMIENGFKCKVCDQSFLYVRHCHRHLSMVHKISEKGERNSLILEPSGQNLTDASSRMELDFGKVPIKVEVPDVPDECSSDNDTMPSEMYAVGSQEDEKGQAGNDFRIDEQEEQQTNFGRDQSHMHNFSWTEAFEKEFSNYNNSLDLIYNQPLNDWSFLYYC